MNIPLTELKFSDLIKNEYGNWEYEYKNCNVSVFVYEEHLEWFACFGENETTLHFLGIAETAELAFEIFKHQLKDEINDLRKLGAIL